MHGRIIIQQLALQQVALVILLLSMQSTTAMHQLQQLLQLRQHLQTVV